MQTDNDRTRPARRRVSRRFAAGLALGAGLLPLALAAPTWAAGGGSHGGTGFSVKVFAAAGNGQSLPDDIAVLGKDVFVGYQNGVGTMGEPSPTGQTQSTVVEYNKHGKVQRSWNVTGKCDGLGADPVSGQILASVNEDGNSSIYTIDPTSGQVDHLTYSPDPESLGGGGTDAISVLNGAIYISGSNPSAADAPAVYQASLDEASGVATLTPLFLDDAAATGPNGPVTLALTDPDSNEVVPSQSPLYAGDFMLDSQGDAQLIFVGNPGTPSQTLTQLPIGDQIDDSAWATSTTGTLYLSDNKKNQVDEIRGTFTPGTMFVSVPNDSNVGDFVGELNMSTGQITPVLVGFGNPHGMVFVAS
jgi:hypothetical protein